MPTAARLPPFPPSSPAGNPSMPCRRRGFTTRSPLATLPRKIVSAWFLGIVGSGEQARCIAYETALNAVIVADVLKPPTYAYGVYGSWEKKPT